MRRITTLTSIGLTLILLFGSCNDFLTKEPLDFLTPSIYFDTEEGIDRGALGVYESLQNRGCYGINLLFQFAANTDIEVLNRDITGTNGRTTKMMVCAHGPDNTELYETWTALYDGVGRANDAIYAIENSKLNNDSLKRRFMAEVRTLRGLFYLHLTVNWRDVPLRLTPVVSAEDIHIAATPQQEIYRHILEDLSFGARYLPAPSKIKASEAGRLTNTAAMGLLARANLYMATAPMNVDTCYKEVIKWTQLIVKSGEHSLNSSYENIFRNHCKDIYEPRENIFEVFFYGSPLSSFSEFGQNGTFNGVKSNDQSVIGFSYGLMYCTPQLFDLFAKHDYVPAEEYIYTNNKMFSKENYSNYGDTRAFRLIANYWHPNATSITYYKNTYGNKYPGKWRRSEEVVIPKSKNQTPTNVPVIRYADVLLMMAEAYNAKDGVPNDSAYWAINQVRRRGFEVSLDAADIKVDVPAGLNGKDFFQWIKDERARELAFEGLRKADLVRWDSYVSYMKGLAFTSRYFADRNKPSTQISNEHIARTCQIWDYIDTCHVLTSSMRHPINFLIRWFK